jgi:hypothetical protein
MKRLTNIGLVVLAIALVLVVGAPGAAEDESTPPTLLEPAVGALFTAGSPIVFRIATFPGDGNGYLWLSVSRSPNVVDACGTIDHDSAIASFVPTTDPSVYEAKPTYLDKPGAYYWQAHRIRFQGGADGCIESEVRPFQIVAKPAPTPTPKPKPTPNPKPKSPGTLSGARLAGSFDTAERFTSVSGINLKVGSKDTGNWSFVPKCSRGACRVSMTFEYGHTMDFMTSHTQRVALVKSGASYSGSARYPAIECGIGNEVVGTLTVRLRTTRGAWINSIWRATRFTGNAQLKAPASSSGIYRCPAARYTATISGSLET